MLVELKEDQNERPILDEMFRKLDTKQKGFLTAKDLDNGMAKVTEDFYTVLGKSKYDFKLDWNIVFKCIDVKGDG